MRRRSFLALLVLSGCKFTDKILGKEEKWEEVRVLVNGEFSFRPTVKVDKDFIEFSFPINQTIEIRTLEFYKKGILLAKTHFNIPATLVSGDSFYCNMYMDTKTLISWEKGYERISSSS